jgi:hypothetical protein
MRQGSTEGVQADRHQTLLTAQKTLSTEKPSIKPYQHASHSLSIPACELDQFALETSMI